MTDHVTVRVVGEAFGVGGDRYSTDETLEVRADVAERHPNTLEVIDEDAEPPEPSGEDDGDEAGEVTVDDLDPHPEDLTVDEIEERVAELEDVDLLETIKDAEEATGDRSTAVDAIEARLRDVREE